MNPPCPQGEDPALKAGGAGSTPAISLFIFIYGGAYTASSISASGSQMVEVKIEKIETFFIDLLTVHYYCFYILRAYTAR